MSRRTQLPHKSVRTNPLCPLGLPNAKRIRPCLAPKLWSFAFFPAPYLASVLGASTLALIQACHKPARIDLNPQHKTQPISIKCSWLSDLVTPFWQLGLLFIPQICLPFPVPICCKWIQLPKQLVGSSGQVKWRAFPFCLTRCNHLYPGLSYDKMDERCT